MGVRSALSIAVLLGVGCGSGATFGGGSGIASIGGDSISTDSGDDGGGTAETTGGADGTGQAATQAVDDTMSPGTADGPGGTGPMMDGGSSSDGGSAGSSGGDTAGDSGGGSSGDSAGDTAGDAGPMPSVPSLNQAIYNVGSGDYEFGGAAIPIEDAPGDVDWSRWGMLHDGGNYRLYFMQAGTDDTVYQFAFNPASSAYEYGYMSIPMIPIVGAPADADMSSFAMLYDGSTFRLYVLSSSAPLRVHQFGFDAADAEYEYDFMSIAEIDVTGTPAGADWDGWGMLHDDGDFRLYAFASAAHTSVAQHGYNAATVAYEYGFESIPQIDITMVPANSNTDDFAMLHDGSDFRFYYLTSP
ncbi:MAG: hypothetical protein AAF721_01655 [Myxococcota bacterium]